MTKIHFRPYIPNQTVLFPQRIDEDIAENDPVRMVESLPVVETLKYGGPDRDHQIEVYKQSLRKHQQNHLLQSRSRYHWQSMHKILNRQGLSNLQPPCHQQAP